MKNMFKYSYGDILMYENLNRTNVMHGFYGETDKL